MHEARNYYAHSGTREDQSDWQPLCEHLNHVARLAADRAKAFNSQAMLIS